jgi:hypothetical protein
VVSGSRRTTKVRARSEAEFPAATIEDIVPWSFPALAIFRTNNAELIARFHGREP